MGKLRVMLNRLVAKHGVNDKRVIAVNNRLGYMINDEQRKILNKDVR